MAFDFDIVKQPDNSVITEITFESFKNTLIYNNKQKSKAITYNDNCITIEYKLDKIFVHIQNTNNNVKVLIQEDNVKESTYNRYTPYDAIPLSTRKMRRSTSLEKTIEHFDSIVGDIAEIFSVFNISKNIYVMQSFNDLDDKNYNNTLLSVTAFYVISKLYDLYKIKPVFINEGVFSNNIRVEVNSLLYTIIVKPYYFHVNITYTTADDIKYINTVIAENSELYKHMGYNVIVDLVSTLVKPEELPNIISSMKGYFKNSMFEGVPPIQCKFNDTKNSIFFDNFIKRRIEYYKNYDVCISRFVRTYMCKFMIGTLLVETIEQDVHIASKLAKHFNRKVEDVLYDIKGRYNWLCQQYIEN
jgi:hypothetical protein